MTNSEPSDFGKRLKRAREVAGVPQRILSRAADASPSLVWHLEKGAVRDVGGSIAASFAVLLDVSMPWLLLGMGEEPNWEAVRATADRIKAKAAENDAAAKAARTAA